MRRGERGLDAFLAFQRRGQGRRLRRCLERGELLSLREHGLPVYHGAAGQRLGPQQGLPPAVSEFLASLPLVGAEGGGDGVALLQAAGEHQRVEDRSSPSWSRA